MKKAKVKKIIYGIVVLVVVFAIIFSFLNKDKSAVEYVFAKVIKGDIMQTVSETGTVKSDSEINLSFLGSGKLKSKNFKVGDKVKVNDVLAELDSSRLEISKKESQANLNSAIQSLDKLLAGATTNERRIARVALDQAHSSLQSAQKDLEKTKSVVTENISQAQKNLEKLEKGEGTALQRAVILAETNLRNNKTTLQKTVDDSRSNAMTTSEDKMVAAGTALDVLDSVLQDEDAEGRIGVQEGGSYEKSLSLYNEARKLSTVSHTNLSAAKTNPTSDNVLQSLQSSLDFQNKVFEALQAGYKALENSITSSDFNQAALDALKNKLSGQQTLVAAGLSATQGVKHSFESAVISYNTTISASEDSLAQSKASLNDAVRSARDAVNTARISGDQQITSAESRVKSAVESEKMAQAELDRVLAVANEYDVLLAKTRITQAEAAVKSIEKQIDDCFIRAPIDGMITDFNFEIGEQVTQGAAVLSLLGENNFKIEVLISEADIAKVNRDDVAEITLDSFGEDLKFAGKVIFIEPAETEIQDVVYYKVDVLFDEAVAGVKSGMTANVIIVTDKKEGALSVSSRAIIDKNGSGKFVKILGADGNPIEKKVEIGLRGDEGVVEILSGLVEGEDVITYTKEEKK